VSPQQSCFYGIFAENARRPTNSLTLGAAYYLMRNLKVVIEVNADLLSEDPAGTPFVGHQTKENYVLIGFDASY
jgi:hypothetical protein